MRNLKISFNEKTINIKYEEYFFNGIQIPKDIEYKYIKNKNLKINWKIDDLNIENIDKNQIKYQLEIKKGNKNLYKIYEGNQTNYLIENLKIGKNYEIRICSIYYI